jgi:porin
LTTLSNCTLSKLETRTEWKSNYVRLVFIAIFISNPFLKAQNATSPAISFSGGYTFDLAANMSGGVKQGTAYLGNVDVNFELNTETLNLWKGGRFFMYLLNNHGNSLSALMGDFQVANNIEAESNTRLYEFWYEHKFQFWSVLIGQHDLNSTFAVSETGLFFINSSFGIQPDISTNVPVSIFPLATLGAVFSWGLGENFKVQHAIYDGDQGSENENPNSLNWSLNKNDGAMFINEISYEIKKDSLLQSTFKLGYWKHTQDQKINNKIVPNSQGIYLISDQVLFRNDASNATLKVFFQGGISLKNHNPTQGYLGGGFLFEGISSKGLNDGIGLAAAHTLFSKSYQSLFPDGLKNETAIELSYQWVTQRRWTFQPNFQYVINPGSDSGLPNALMGLVRLKYDW